MVVHQADSKRLPCAISIPEWQARASIAQSETPCIVRALHCTQLLVVQTAHQRRNIHPASASGAVAARLNTRNAYLVSSARAARHQLFPQGPAPRCFLQCYRTNACCSILPQTATGFGHADAFERCLQRQHDTTDSTGPRTSQKARPRVFHLVHISPPPQHCIQTVTIDSAV